ncbi:hypothetical protein DER46DRAFT_206826 [Fusarium sp. MPI-SDFR-AT-0072]|nr:hypothetical protein DER46DRAFT_206826 [Fusarium sp. MPI-SDFR-AT-0072]
MCRTRPRRHIHGSGDLQPRVMAGTARKANLPRKLSIEPRVPQRRLCKSGAKSIRPALEIDMSFGSRPRIIIIDQGEVLCSLPNLASSEPASTPPCYRAWQFILFPAQSQVGSLNWVCRAPYPPQRSSDMSPSQSLRALAIFTESGPDIILALLGLRNDADIEPFKQRILADSQPSRLPEYTSRIMSSSLRRCDIFYKLGQKFRIVYSPSALLGDRALKLFYRSR